MSLESLGGTSFGGKTDQKKVQQVFFSFAPKVAALTEELLLVLLIGSRADLNHLKQKTACCSARG